MELRHLPADRWVAVVGMDEAIFLPPGAGRAYDAGPMHAVFKADGVETGDRYCVSEWIEAPRGSFLRIPAGTTHDFENRGSTPAGVLNVFIPGGFETMMPRIVAYMAN